MIDESTSIPLVCSFASFCLSNINYLDCVSINGFNIYGVVNVFHFLKMMDFFTQVCYLHVVAPQGSGEIPDTSKLPPILCKHFPSKIIKFLIPLNNIYVGQTIKSNIWGTIRLCQQEIF